MGKIQERCCQGLSASSASQRAIVAAEASLTPRSTTSRCSSAREKRESGMPCSRGSSQATAFTRATSSGGKTARAARALQVLESFEPLVAETSSPASHRLPRHPQPLADLDVRPALGRQEHQPRPLHLPVRVGVAGRAVLELGPLDLAEHDLMGAASRHRPAISPRLSSLLQARWDF